MTDASSVSGVTGGETGDIAQLVTQGLTERARSIVPWFQQNMPHYYFRTHDTAEQIRHIQGLISADITTDRHALALKSPCGTKVTYISPGGEPAKLMAALDELAEETILNARMYASKDDLLRLDTFIMSPQQTVDRHGAAFAAAMEELRKADLLPQDEIPAFEDFLATATGDCVDKFEVDRAVRHFQVYKDVSDGDRVLVYREDEVYSGETRIMVAMTSPPKRGIIQEMVRLMVRCGCKVERAYGDIYDTPVEPFGIFSFYLTACDSAPLHHKASWEALESQLSRVKWYAGGHELEWFADQRGWSISQVMFLHAATEFAHQFLLGKDLYAYTAHNIIHSVLGHPDAAQQLLDCFEARFNPNDEERLAHCDARLTDLHAYLSGVSDEVVQDTFRVMELFIMHTLRTNYYLPNRFALSFRMDPDILDHLPPLRGVAESDDKPYGFFFFHGAHFQGFHVRYREMARGGVRVVTTRSQENFELESNRLFAEVTALARSQQHKNKDIPEGGSKAVLLLGPRGDIDLAVKAAVDAMLDIIVMPGDTGEGSFTLPGVVDYLKRGEIIYLGPDEHISPSHIEWIVARARKRGFRWPAAFMSSKPSSGINHKEYGVTSIGVIVFAEEMLGVLGIDPHRDSFRVKFTGGPRGDVAGNAMLLLMDQYGENARIVGVTDGHGAAFDPTGLDHGELRRLIAENRGIREFDPAKLKGGKAAVAGTDTPEGVRMRDSLHNTAEADIFIPSGGRPDTINDANWNEFLLPDGRPSAKAIVEGANIFLSPGARAHLQDHGVLIMHGASANKTGVICSSYEILAGLTLSEEEFLAIKEEYVQQVLDILRLRARSEARMMLREYKRCGACKPLTALTMELSKEINTIADQLAAGLRMGRTIHADPELRKLVLEYCPAVLSQKYADRIFSRIPEGHLQAMVAAYAASRIVYAEGLGWLPRISEIRDVGEAVQLYLQQERRMYEHIQHLDHAAVQDREELRDIVAQAGCRYMTERLLGLH